MGCPIVPGLFVRSSRTVHRLVLEKCHKLCEIYVVSLRGEFESCSHAVRGLFVSDRGIFGGL